MVVHAPKAAANSADDEIVRLVRDDARPQEIRVVTSDNTLINPVNAAGASVYPSGELPQPHRSTVGSRRGIRAWGPRRFAKNRRPNPKALAPIEEIGQLAVTVTKSWRQFYCGLTADRPSMRPGVVGLHDHDTLSARAAEAM
jgi:hypothetical protein